MKKILAGHLPHVKKELRRPKIAARSRTAMAAYLPVYCASCARASLSSKSASEPQLCAFCEGPARVVPGPLYGDGDWLAFADIERAVFDTELNGAEAGALAEELQQMLIQDADAQSVVRQMMGRLPSLQKCRPALVNGVQRGLRMLATLLVARSLEQRPSTSPSAPARSPERRL